MRYIGKFATSGNVQTAINEERLLKPYVAYVQDDDYIDWNTKKAKEADQPLTFVIISDGSIKWSCYEDTPPNQQKTIEYSKNGGEWISITSNTGNSAPSIGVDAGDIVQFRGDNQYYGGNRKASLYKKCFISHFSGSTASFNLEGNIMSLISSTNFENITALPQIPATSDMTAYTFSCFGLIHRGLFQGCNVIDASNLLLPATALTDFCYCDMFYGCTNLTSAPELPATTLVQRCYENMFYNCTNLNSVKAMFTATPSTSYTNGWLAFVSSTGTFYKNPLATWDEDPSFARGSSTVPANWTIENAQ